MVLVVALDDLSCGDSQSSYPSAALPCFSLSLTVSRSAVAQPADCDGIRCVSLSLSVSGSRCRLRREQQEQAAQRHSCRHSLTHTLAEKRARERLKTRESEERGSRREVERQRESESVSRSSRSRERLSSRSAHQEEEGARGGGLSRRDPANRANMCSATWDRGSCLAPSLPFLPCSLALLLTADSLSSSCPLVCFCLSLCVCVCGCGRLFCYIQESETHTHTHSVAGVMPCSRARGQASA